MNWTSIEKELPKLCHTVEVMHTSPKGLRLKKVGYRVQNLLCGQKVDVWLTKKGQRIEDVTSWREIYKAKVGK